MISDVFIDRPRLSIVISVVITIAGLIAITQIPVAQFPDIVPPQVQVTTSYPGASAAVVESTVGQPIESKVNGVDNMLYMKSSSANDGSYTLNVSFALGTDPDINTVNVQNRVNQATAQLPEEVSRQGLTVKKKSTAMLQVVSADLAQGGLRRACSSATTRPSMWSTPWRGYRVWARCSCSARWTTACASGCPRIA